jgi:predicted  nucleic acid-binding Zn-ribbon protein
MDEKEIFYYALNEFLVYLQKKINRMSTNYINLPRLERISVQNYTLFLKDWSYKLIDGLNLFIGANGLGKTTTTYLIIYGITGVYEDEIDTNYFKQRGNNQDINDNNPSVTIEFAIKDNSILIERYLYQNKIKRLVINEASYDESVENLEIFYNDSLMEYIGISNLGDIVFLLKKFMIRAEEGNYLLWDSLDQSKLIRLIINSPGFEDEYSKIEKEVQKYDTLYRGNQDTKAQFVKRQNDLKIEKEKILNKKQDYQSRKVILEDNETIEEALNNLSLKRQRIFENINYYTDNLKTSDREIEQVSFEIESRNDKIISKEKIFYSSIYSDDKILSAIHKLKNYNICIYCNNKITPKISNQIVETVEISEHCPVCDSKLQKNNEIKSSSKDVSPELNTLKREIDNYQENLLKYKNNKELIIKELYDNYKMLNDLDSELNIKSIDVFTLKQKLADIDKNPGEAITEYDSGIIELQKQIDQYELIIKDNKNKFDREIKKLNRKNDELNETIKSFTSKLNDIFRKYSTSYFNENCSLVHIVQNVRHSKVPLTTFIPEFENKKRNKIGDCSTSERIFLEYLFRFSLIELYNKVTKSKSFFILETSEGAFDLSNTLQLAEALKSYSKNNFPFVVIANFSKTDFLKDLLSPYTNPKERALSFIEFGRLSVQQKKKIKEFNKVLTILKII